MFSSPIMGPPSKQINYLEIKQYFLVDGDIFGVDPDKLGMLRNMILMHSVNGRYIID